MIEKCEAHTILSAWAHLGSNIGGSSSMVKRITEQALPNETLLETVARLAEINVTGVKPFDYLEISRRIAIADILDPFPR